MNNILKMTNLTIVSAKVTRIPDAERKSRPFRLQIALFLT